MHSNVMAKYFLKCGNQSFESSLRFQRSMNIVDVLLRSTYMFHVKCINVLCFLKTFKSSDKINIRKDYSSIKFISTKSFWILNCFCENLFESFPEFENQWPFPIIAFRVQKLRNFKEFPMKHLGNQKGIFGYRFGFQINFFDCMSFLRYLYSSRT
jgi:hypothetical protein